jgi:hypothetical protein
VGYPNDAERRRLERFPERIAIEDLRACFALSDRDRVLIFEQRGPVNRLGLAVSLCALRFLGFVPDDIASIPDEALGFVASQVDAAPHELLTFGPEGRTLASASTDHTIRLWDTRTHKQLRGPLPGHTDIVRNVAFSPDGPRWRPPATTRRSGCGTCAPTSNSAPR